MSTKGAYKPQLNNSMQNEPGYETDVCKGAAMKVILL